jgi:tRNA 2-thiouridine synthesizing protein A
MIRIDARGMRCPWPAIRAARALRENAGEAIEIMADDPAAERELGLLAEAQGLSLETNQTSNCHSFRLIPYARINSVFTSRD